MAFSSFVPFKHHKLSAALLYGVAIFFSMSSAHGQTIYISGAAGGKRFDGIGAVSGGGATSVLLKDYPEPQRSQVLDFLFKPRFGASISALLVEVPGDGNSTQGSEPSHMHTRTDENYSRGYEWWLMREAKKRNPAITLDANAWGCPKWVGNGRFWSQDMCDYYAKWIKGLKTMYGIDLDAVGCRNEKGVDEGFVKKLRATLDANGLARVKIHAFDNWGSDKFAWAKDMLTDSALRASVDVMSAHTMSEIATPADVIKLSNQLGKPIWNSEEHIYKDGYDCEISLVEAFNKNYIESGVTKIVNWYLVASTYGIEPFAVQPAIMVAREPWGGNYYTRQVLWGYAHYGQFCQAGWQYVNGACGHLDGGGTYVTLKSPGGGDYSIIAETKNAKQGQTINFKVSGLSGGNLCVWRSNARQQFVRLGDIKPVNGAFSITLDTASIYSISTTTGQQKGSFGNVPSSKPFPFPYKETFEQYKYAKQWGYLPHYTADISGIFEIAARPDGKGNCLRQVIDSGAQSWAPEWRPYTIIGDARWADYEVKADINLAGGGWAGVMGRINGTGTGYGTRPNGYYFTLSPDGSCALYVSRMDAKSDSGLLLASGKVPNMQAAKWHTLSLRFCGASIAGYVDGTQALGAQDSVFAAGMAGLVTGSADNKSNSALFDNLVIQPIRQVVAVKATIPKNVEPMYGGGK